MIFLKTVYTVLFAWLIFRVVRLTNEDRKTLFYSSTNILTSPGFSQARHMRKDSTSLSILRTVRNASALLQRSSLPPLMLVLLANDVQLNPGPSHPIPAKPCKTNPNDLKVLYLNARSLKSFVPADYITVLQTPLLMPVSVF